MPHQLLWLRQIRKTESSNTQTLLLNVEPHLGPNGSLGCGQRCALRSQEFRLCAVHMPPAMLFARPETQEPQMACQRLTSRRVRQAIAPLCSPRLASAQEPKSRDQFSTSLCRPHRPAAAWMRPAALQGCRRKIARHSAMEHPAILEPSKWTDILVHTLLADVGRVAVAALNDV